MLDVNILNLPFIGIRLIFFSSRLTNWIYHFSWCCRYSNMFVTSPSPENLHTLFEFVFKGFDALEFQVRMKSVAILIHFYLYRLRYTCCSMLTRKGILSVCNNWQEHLDYELVQSTNPEFNKAVVRVNIFRDHRQTIQVSIKRGMFLIPISATCIDKPPIIV